MIVNRMVSTKPPTVIVKNPKRPTQSSTVPARENDIIATVLIIAHKFVMDVSYLKFINVWKLPARKMHPIQ